MFLKPVFYELTHLLARIIKCPTTARRESKQRCCITPRVDLQTKIIVANEKKYGIAGCICIWIDI